MPSRKDRLFFQFEGVDVRDVVDQYDSADFADPDNSSVISNQPGVGRTLDKAISSAGRQVERALGHISESWVRKRYFAPSSVEFGDEVDIEDLTRRLGPTHFFEVDDGFTSNQPGVGSTLDDAISTSGRHLEAAFGSISERLGQGPHAAMSRCLVAAESVWLRSRNPRFSRRIGSTKFMQRPPHLSQLLGQVSALDSLFLWPTKELVSDPTVTRACQTLISYLKSDKSETQLLALYYITAISCVNPDISSHLVKLGARKAIDAITSPHSWLFKPERHQPLLLASSRRALVTLSDSAFPTIKEFIEIFRTGSADESPKVHRSDELVSNLLDLSLNANCGCSSYERKRD
ncbi:hypothetical protein JAAARDRAFT_500496 [Jaapia argillacea MUCL 33604]|uniref:Uncharacterized protein n=1 Tax=Jaapia argillacea MUCL 33604 TaxID=933084 RepID=A0A067P9N3_9AGAM|nr:hypothetical protein JAAARDRAFT_500496 [Jaapia argillacea MUCL 33604]